MVEHLLIDTGIAQGIPYSKYPNLDTILICIVSIFRRGNKPAKVLLLVAKVLLSVAKVLLSVAKVL